MPIGRSRGWTCWCTAAPGWTCTATRWWPRCGSRVRGGAHAAQHTRTFATTTAGITALGDWLAEHGVTRAGMESTGVYWKPVVRHEALLNRAEVKGLRRWSVAAG